MSSAAVALYAAAVLPEVPSTVSARDLAVGLFLPPQCATHFADPSTPGKTTAVYTLLPWASKYGLIAQVDPSFAI